MSTKRLARTVIEPGRSAATKRDRVTNNRGERRAARMSAHAFARDPDRADRVPHVERERVRVIQHDKLRPLERWLDAQVGRPWNEVYAEIRASVDTRTTPGRHILYDHLLGDVENNGVTRERRWSHGLREWWVDDEGILRGHSRVCNPNEVWWKAWVARERKRMELAAFVAGRCVRELGATFFWGEPTPNGLTRRYRQDRRLADDEVATWLSFDESLRRVHTWMAPEHPAR